MKEVDLYEQLARYLNVKHPSVLYHFDLAGVNNPSPYTRSLYGRLNKRAWPDLFIASPHFLRGDGGYFLELKKEGTRIYKRDGSLVADRHIQEQAHMLQHLREHGYRADFGVGYDQSVELIEAYLQSGKKRVQLRAQP